MLKKIIVFTGTFVLICSLSGLSGAAVVGPLDPVTNFPIYYKDDKGVSAAGPPPIGDGHKAPTNIFTPVAAGNPVSASTGFGAEFFYWLAKVDSRTFRTRSGKVEISFGLVATYAGGTPQEGKQTVFSRVRFQALLPAPGTYILDHPYGTESFNVTAEDVSLKKPINITRDLGAAGDFNAVNAQGGGVLKGFLVANTIAANPDEWLGDGVTVSSVTGGPVRNFVKLIGPAGAKLDPVTNANFIYTDLLIVSGHIWHHRTDRH
ncbi:MAG: hypothetical protein AB1424_01415 [Thermodesulfobacteriota bacterium]